MTAKHVGITAMRAVRTGLLSTAIFQLAIGSPFANAQTASTTSSSDNNTATPIKHVIVIIGENRSFDHVFATYVPTGQQSVRNLLSEQIVNADGTPGPNFAQALQTAATDMASDAFLLSKAQLQRAVLSDPGITIYRCGRSDVASGAIDKRILAVLAFLSRSGLKPTVSALRCGQARYTSSGEPSAQYAGDAVDISAINGVPIAGHQGPGSIADETVRKLLMLQGVNRPQRIVSQLSYPGVTVASASPSADAAIEVGFRSPAAAVAHGAALADTVLKPSQWIQLIARLGEIPDPTVAAGPSPAAIPDTPSAVGEGQG